VQIYKILYRLFSLLRKFAKTTIKFVMFVFPSVRPSTCNNSAPNGHTFWERKIEYFSQVCWL